MTGSFLIGLIVGGVLMSFFVVDSRNERDTYLRKCRELPRQRFYYEIASYDVCKELARRLEIEADGGDDPAAFVQESIKDLWREADRRASH